MQNIVPNLWFDDQAEQAVERYLEVFDETSLGRRTEYNETMAQQSGQAAGALMAQEVTLEGFDFVAFNGGPHFEMNPSISFIVNCPTVSGTEALWQGLMEGGKAMMPLQEYEFSDCYGWCEDAFGASWQLMHTPQAPERLIVPSLMFVGDQYGRAAEAIELYTQVFDNSEVGSIHRAPGEEGDDGQGPVMFADFTLRGVCLAAMDDDAAHDFQFNEGISLIVNCADQAEVDRYWDALTADGGQAQQCGWLKDTFGVRWQIVPERLTELLWETDPATSERVAEALLQMQRIDVGALEVAAQG